MILFHKDWLGLEDVIRQACLDCVLGLRTMVFYVCFFFFFFKKKCGVLCYVSHMYE
jgi:hypothetical protein